MKLSEYLEENGISQKFFASKIHYSHQYLNSVIKGRKKAGKPFINAVNKYIESTLKHSSQIIPTIEWGNLKGEYKQHNE